MLFVLNELYKMYTLEIGNHHTVIINLCLQEEFSLRGGCIPHVTPMACERVMWQTDEIETI